MEIVSAGLSPTAMEVIIKGYSQLNFYDLLISIVDIKLTNDEGKRFDVSEENVIENENKIKYIRILFEATIFDENENFNVCV